ncbi:YggS family pyridoxal phosphate-dependent enzyme [Gracilibacillus alcaliphilus]|uniref:YggS family pyridoxal phosphate-dependent enzyme n=1 Tax=Gracilibacillus alcaliphilus TaxID=1401441 RepID=UPI001959159F|nr:pyridoxal phosphate enzyme (YggS family) [Gracilibacillus alcaliphilus]
MKVIENLAHIQAQIKEACQKVDRDPEDIKIIAVTKYVTIERTQEALQAGINDFGENRPDGFQAKYAAIGKQAQWHFIGTLQSRKVKDVIDKMDYLHSLDRKSLAKEINKRAEKPVDCFVQVNVSGEDSKHGLAVDEVIPFVELLKDYSNIHVVGLMTMAPHISDEERLRDVFRSLRQLRDTIVEADYDHAPCRFLSMGMSNDYQIAIQEGATHIRIGSDLVGPYQE